MPGGIIMYNDDEVRTDTENGAPSSISPEAATNTTEDAQPSEVRPQEAFWPRSDIQQPNEVRTENPVVTGQKEKEAHTNPYYEPWQQPAYREAKVPGQEPYSPGIHGGAYNAYQRFQPAPPPPEKKRKSEPGWFAKAVCLVLVCLLVSGGATYGVMQYTLRDFKNNNQTVLGGDIPPEGSTPEPSDPAPEDSGSAPTASLPSAAPNVTYTGTVMPAEDIYAMAVNQVVGVNSEEKTNVFGASTPAAVSGSGFIISEDGYIVTNYHVISFAVDQGFTLTVMMHDGTAYPAKVIGYESDNDLAVIKIEASGLSAVTQGDNDAMKVGETIYAVGNPLGQLDYTMTNGIVSALDRNINVDEATSINMFQIDAAVNSGNSGGPVYNSRGEVIGIVSAKYASTGVEGLGFAIPINDAKGIIDELIKNGRVSGKPSMGITVKTVTSAAVEYYKIVEGAYVVSVLPGSCAEKAGLKVGDIITKLGDTDVTSSDTLKQAKKDYKAGDTTMIVVNRDGEELSLKITFDEEGVTATSSTQQPAPTFPSTPNGLTD